MYEITEQEKTALELRAYFFVPYNISEMQRGVQGIHAAFRYGRKFANDETFQHFVDNCETVIILNGGTTDDERDFEGFVAGTLNQIADDLLKNEIPFTYFIEPDLNHALTALCFIADERVYDKEHYPDFVNYLIDNYKANALAQEIVGIRMLSNEELITAHSGYYKEWVREQFVKTYKKLVKSIKIYEEK